MLTRPAYLVHDQQGPLAQLDSSVVFDADSGVTLMGRSHDPVAAFRDRDGRYSCFIAASKKQPGIAAQDVLVCVINHQGIVRPGGAIQIP
jgi:hypothetical protein